MLKPIVLRKHQQRFVESNPHKALLCWEMRTGKSLPASIWGQTRSSNCIVVCPKQLKQDWKTLAPFATVFSKEEFKKKYKNIRNPSALIVDECHTFASPLFTKNRSQLATAMYSFIKDNPEMGVLLLSATPIRNDPSSLHTLLCYMGRYIPWKDWRDVFYELQYRPYLPRPAYFPKANWRITIRTVLEKYADIVSLKDCVDYLPPITSEIVKIDTPKYIRPTDEEYRWTNEHQHEQINKAEYIKSLGYRKIIIACHYTFQIDELKKILEKDRQVFVLDGRTKDPNLVKKQAQEADECYWILQSSMGFGLDAWMFGALVFASMSHTALHHTQMTGRMTSVDYPKPIFMYYLIGGIWDKRIYDSIIKNQDFNPHIYLNEK